jgi:hypothetical protein
MPLWRRNPLKRGTSRGISYCSEQDGGTCPPLGYYAASNRRRSTAKATAIRSYGLSWFITHCLRFSLTGQVSGRDHRRDIRAPPARSLVVTRSGIAASEAIDVVVANSDVPKGRGVHLAQPVEERARAGTIFCGADVVQAPGEGAVS